MGTSDKVKLVSTDKDKYHKTGSVFEAYADAARSIIAKGHATEYTGESDSGSDQNDESHVTSPKKKKKNSNHP